MAVESQGVVAMKVTIHLLVALILLSFFKASAEMILIKRLVPENVSADEHFAVAVSSKIGKSARFTVTVTPKEGKYPSSTDVRLMLFDGINEIEEMSLNNQVQVKGRPYHYTFDIGTNYLASSQFIFRYSDWTTQIRSEDSANSIYFFLKDFLQ